MYYCPRICNLWQDPSKASPFKGGFNRFITFRGNKIASNGGIVIRGTSANTLVTGSAIQDSYVGIHVNYTTTNMFGKEGGGIVVINNSVHTNVPANYNPYSGNQERRNNK